MGLDLFELKLITDDTWEKILIYNRDFVGEYYYGLLLDDFRVKGKFLVKKTFVELQRAPEVFEEQLWRLHSIDNRYDIEVDLKEFYNQYVCVTNGEYVSIINLTTNIEVDSELEISTTNNNYLEEGWLISIEDYNKDFQTLIKLKNESK